MRRKLIELFEGEGYTPKEIAKYLGITTIALGKRVNGKREFTCSEIYALSDIFGVKTIASIFFDDV